MINRTKEIQRIIDENGYKTYLELGLGSGHNFDAIKIDYETGFKIGVDPVVPNTIKTGITKKQDSDTFFEWYLKECQEDKECLIDLCFIDSLHHAEQVERDIINSWNCLNKGGQIIIHDVKPLDEVCQRVPRESIAWTGDVWRAWYGLKKAYPKLKFDYIDERTGLGIIHKSRHKIEAGFIDWKTTYEEYHKAKWWGI